MEEEIGKTELLGEGEGETTESLISGLTKKRGGRVRVNPSLESQTTENDPNSKTEIKMEETKAIEESTSHQLEEAANLLLGLLDTSLKEFVFEMADLTLKIPRWQLLLGALVAQNESGNLGQPSIDPSWQGGNFITLKESNICQQCKKPFQPIRFGQKFCSNKCGDEARKVDILAMRKQRAEDLAFQRKINEAQRRGASAA